MVSHSEGKFLLQCFPCLFMQNRSVGKTSNLLKTYQQHRAGIAMPKKKVSFDILCHEESYRRSPLGGSAN